MSERDTQYRGHTKVARIANGECPSCRVDLDDHRCPKCGTDYSGLFDRPIRPVSNGEVAE